MSQHDEQTPRRSILPWAALATLIAAVIVIATAPLISALLLDPAFCRRFSDDATLFEGIVALTAPIIFALATWIAFYIFVFKSRGSIWKSLLALPIMIFSTVVIGVIAHLCFYAPGLAQQEKQVEAWRRAEQDRVAGIRATLFADLGGPLDRGIPRVQSPQDVELQLTRIQNNRTRIQAYERDMFAHLHEAQSSLVRLSVLDGPKEQGLAYYERILAPNSDTRRHFALTYQALDRQEAFLKILRAHPGGWFVTRNRLVFTDIGLLAQVNTAAQGLEGIMYDLNHLEGSMGIEVGATAPND